MHRQALRSSTGTSADLQRAEPMLGRTNLILQLKRAEGKIFGKTNPIFRRDFKGIV
jgi:hypothetical protein